VAVTCIGDGDVCCGRA